MKAVLDIACKRIVNKLCLPLEFTLKFMKM